MRLRGLSEGSIIKRSFWRSKTLAAVLLLLIILISYPLAKRINQRRALNGQILELQTEAERITNKNKDLSGLINYLQSGSFTEKEARLKMDLKKPGENVIVVTNPEVEVKPSQESKEEKPRLNNPTKWWYYFTRHELPKINN